MLWIKEHGYVNMCTNLSNKNCRF